MRTARLFVATSLTLLVVAAAAGAESTTVQGKGDIDKMFANNGQDAMTVKLFGLAKPCRAHFFKITIFWGDRPAYTAEAGCYGVEWIEGLYYTANRNSGAPGKKVDCPGFRVRYNADNKVYRTVVPRSCMDEAPGRVRVRAEGRNYAGSTIGGEAGPTERLSRG